MLSGIKLERSWPSEIGGYLEAIRAAVAEAQDRIDSDSGDRDLAAEKTVASSYLSRALQRHLEQGSVYPTGGKEWVRIPGLCIVRCKAVDDRLASRSTKTQHDAAFRSQDVLPGLEAEELVCLELAYQFDPTARRIMRAYLIERDGDGILAQLQINLDGTVEETTALPLMDLTPTVKPVPEVAARRRGAGRSAATS